MRRLFVFSLFLAFAISIAAVAHWDGVNHKMHFPQLPDTLGWDVWDVDPIILADDWQCSETGYVHGVHFWGSWQADVVGEIEQLRVSYWSDFPDPDGPGPLFSHPDTLIQECVYLLPSPWVHIEEYELSGPYEGWMEPGGIATPNDHTKYFLYNIDLDPWCRVPQVEGNVYWLSVNAIVTSGPSMYWGWKTADVDQYPEPYDSVHFNDDAVFAVTGFPPDPADWQELVDPFTFESLDLSFVITGWGPGAIGLVSFTANTYDRYVDVNWQTETEFRNSGFNLYRASTTDGPRTRLNDDVIPSKGNELEGASYSYRDFDVAGGYYWFEDVDLDGNTSLYGPVKASQPKNAPTAFSLTHRPNPFNPTAQISYSLPENVHVTLEIYNVQGQLVKSLVNEHQQAGDKVVTWNGTNANGEAVSSGTYFCKIHAGGYMSVQKMVLLK